MNKPSLLFLLLICFSFPILAKNIPVVTKIIKFQSDLQQPSAVAISEQGQVYVLDGANNRVVVFSQTGKKLFEFGAKGKNRLDKPMDISLFANQIVVADTGLERLVIYDLQGKFIKEIELDTGGDEKIVQPVPISVFMDENYIYWGDRANHRICKTDLKTNALLHCFGKRGETAGLFQYPWQITTDRDGYLHIVDVLNGRVQIFHKTGQFFSQISRFGLDENELYRPNGIAIDKSDTVFVSDSYFGTISLFDNNTFINKLRMTDQSLLKFKVPVGIALYKNYLYVVDAEENSVYQLNLTYVDEKTIQSTPIKSHPVALSQKNCVTCHLSWAKEKQLDSQKYKDEVLPVASFEMCYSCHHGVILDSRLMIKHGDQHPTIYDLEKDKLTLKEMNAREDKLPKEFPITKNKEMLCSSCHTPHNSDKGAQTLYVEHQNAWLRVSNKDGDLCERCHESKTKNARELDKKNRGINHPLAIKLKTPPKKGELGYATEKELQKGLPDELKKALASLSTQSQIICQSCHQIHGGKGNDLLAITKNKGALCVQCHAKQNAKNKKDAHRKGIHPVNVKLEKPIKRKGEKIAKVTCDSCHKVHNGSLGTDLLPDYMKKSEDLCMDCHERQHAKDEKEALKKGVHPTNEKLEEPVTIAGKKIHKLGCLSCHSIHDGEPNTPALVQEYKKDQLCKNCHKEYFAKDKKDALKKGIHPMNHKLEKAVKIAKKEVQQMGCLSCHVIHKDGIAETPALLEKYKDGEICKNCHENKRPIVGTDHDLRITAKNKKNHFDELPRESGVCGTCHTMHRGEGKQPHLFAAKIVTNTVKEKDNNKNDQPLFEEDKLCLNCHQQGGIAKKKTIKYFSHPYRDMILRSDEKIMPLLGKHGTIKEFGSIACITCHEPHLWQSLAVNKNPKPLLNKKNIEGTVKNSFLRRLGVVDTFCVDCHSLEALPKYKYYHDKDKVRNIGVDYLK